MPKLATALVDTRFADDELGRWATLASGERDRYRAMAAAARCFLLDEVADDVLAAVRDEIDDLLAQGEKLNTTLLRIRNKLREAVA